jgi:RNA polymerase sigma-70 factor (ECF subfamily)
MARVGLRRVSARAAVSTAPSRVHGPDGAGLVTPLDRDRPLVLAAQRDPAAFDALYRRYLAQVYSFAFYALGNHHDAEDATARVFLNALAALPRFQERARPADGEEASTFRVWLFQIARNEIARHRRMFRRRPQAPLEAAATVEDPGDDPGQTAARHDAALAAIAALRRLPADRRRALVLRFVDEMSTAEIAGVLGRSEGAVRVLIHRALRTIAADLEAPGPPGRDA